MEYESINILKVKGLNSTQDYIQIRDKNLSLIANLKIKAPFENIISFFKDKSRAQKVIDLINELPYGILTKIEF